MLAAAVMMTATAPAHAVYNAAHGRFLQRDPIGAMNVTGIVYFHPITLAPIIDKPCKDCISEYENGMNVYEGIAGNPVNYIDPFGRDWLDEEGNDTDATTWGGATAQISIVSGQLFSLANVGTMLAESWVWLTGGSGRGWLDTMTHCVQKSDPLAYLSKVEEVIGKLGSVPFMPIRKDFLFFGEDLATAKALTGDMGSVTGRLAWAGMKAEWPGWITSSLKWGGRFASKASLSHGLYMAGLETVCFGYGVGLQVYDYMKGP